MGLLSFGLVVGVVSYIAYFIFSKAKYIYSKLTVFQGPAAVPVLGNLHQFHFTPEEFFEQAQGLGYLLRDGEQRVCRVWLGGLPFVLLYGAEECEAILGSNKMLNKPFHYNYLGPWIGEGLLISKPDKWRPRRKLLTPTFHYDILKDFVEVYNKHARILANKLGKFANDGDFHEIFHTISYCTLDVICEAALGVSADCQSKPNNPYLDAVFKMKYIVHQRIVKPYFYPEFLFYWFGAGREMDKCVKILHDFTWTAIAARKEKADAAGGVEKLLVQETSEGRRRMAFLDLMLDMHAKGDIDMTGIQEEVDTFTFEAHDTTSASINWFLHLMGANPDVQAKVHKEIDDVLGEGDRPITYEDLGRFKYLEACIKETLRLYPSVPLIARQVMEDVNIKGATLPAGTGVVMIASMVHKDPRYWTDPEVFNPDRFINGDIKHAYAYIPFSAGSRNCIGQRFAIMEEKVVLSTLLRQLRVESKLRTDQMRVAAELIIRPMHGNHIRFHRRQFGEY